MRTARSPVLIMLFVLLSYMVFAYNGSSEFATFSKVPQTQYQYLTEAFSKGQLHFVMKPPEEYTRLSNPYDFMQFRHIQLADGQYMKEAFFDVSFYKNKFYLYFGPLPVIFFNLPFKWMTGFYPSSNLTILFFLSIGFCVLYSLLWKIQRDYFPRVSATQISLAGLVMGFVWPIIILFGHPLLYEIAISSAFCFVSFALYFIYLTFENNFKYRYLFLASLFLAMSVAGRPNFALICVAVTPVLLWQAIKFSPKNYLVSCISLLAPMFFIGLALAFYNYARFDSFFEFGPRYQLPGGDTHGLFQGIFQFEKILTNIKFGFYNYYMRPLTYLTYPFLNTQYEGKIAANYYFYDNSAGLLGTSPFLFLSIAWPFLFKNNLKKLTTLRNFLMVVTVMVLTTQVFLLIISIGSPRYAADFVPYLLMLAIITLWMLKNTVAPFFYKIINTLFWTSAVYSIYVGFCFVTSMKAYNSAIVNFHKLGLEFNLHYGIFGLLIIILIFSLWRLIDSPKANPIN